MNSEQKVPWDWRLAERMARQSWEAANSPSQRRKPPPLKERARSIYFWAALSALLAGFVLVYLLRRNVWQEAIGIALYLAGTIVMALGNRRLQSRR
jgi:membrane associated rhomboid family serine protease